MVSNKVGDKPTYVETPVGAGYYALRHTTAKSGIKYTKLVKADRSPGPKYTFGMAPKLVPSVGHNARRQQILDKRKTNERGN